jgi:pimeloyl-ACP methyl ester carboxylesterase
MKQFLKVVCYCFILMPFALQAQENWMSYTQTIPTQGDRDVIRPEHTLKLFQNIPNSYLCILPGSTHGASWNKRTLFMQLLNDFFDKPFEMPTTEDWYKE